MIQIPKTRAEAEKYRYNCWGGNPKGTAYDPLRCAYEVHAAGRAAMFYQCTRKPGFGPSNLYCSTHDPARQEARKVKQTADYEAKMAPKHRQWDILDVCADMSVDEVKEAVGQWKRKQALSAKTGTGRPNRP